MVLDTSLLNTQQYKVHIKGKVEQSRERSRALPYACSSYWKEILQVANFTFYLYGFKYPFLFNNNHLFSQSYVVWFGLVWFGFMAYQPL